jgi:TfoX/Sxy family transcriptional regulator of competence genes
MIDDHAARPSLQPRRRGEELLHVLAARFPVDAAVTEDRMFNGQGLKLGTKFFAFVSHTGELVIKVSQAEASRLVDDRVAEPMIMRNRTMREWVRIPYPVDGDQGQWQQMLRLAWRYAAGSAQPAR